METRLKMRAVHLKENLQLKSVWSFGFSQSPCESMQPLPHELCNSDGTAVLAAPKEDIGTGTRDSVFRYPASLSDMGSKHEL